MSCDHKILLPSDSIATAIKETWLYCHTRILIILHHKEYYSSRLITIYTTLAAGLLEASHLATNINIYLNHL